MFSLVVIAAILIYSNNAVQAREDVVAVDKTSTEESTFGTVLLVAPTSRVPKGLKLTAAYLREIHWPRDQVPEGAARSIGDLVGMYTTNTLPANQPIVRTAVSPNPPSYGIGELLPPGHRAVTIEVDAITGVEGWATPGAHVDVYLTHREESTGVFKTRVAVEDAVVLSYGGEAKKINPTDRERTKIQSTVTLAVSFEDSLKIQTAKAIGRITLALRNSTDVGSQGNGEFAATDWNGQQAAPKSNNKFVSKGFAKFSDGSGNEQQFVLGSDERWWKSGGQ
jgi:pilus assembly protein CpaB